MDQTVATLLAVSMLDDDSESFEGGELRRILPFMLLGSAGQPTTLPQGATAPVASAGMDPCTILLFAVMGGRKRHSRDRLKE